MSLKRFVMVLAILSIFLSAGTTMAVEAWYTCEIDDVAVIAPNTEYPDGAYAFQFSDTAGAFTETWFYVSHADTRKGMMAICLTAIATDRLVKIYADPYLVTGLEEVHMAPCDFSAACE